MYLLFTITAWPYLVFAPIKNKFSLEIVSLAKSSFSDNYKYVTSTFTSACSPSFSLLTSSFLGFALLDPFIVCANDTWGSLCVLS